MRGESPRVIILQRTLTDYRLACFDHLYEQLKAAGIRLSVHVGEAKASEFLASATDERVYLKRVHNQYLGGGLYWQWGALAGTRACDMIVFEQANSALYVYALIVRRKLRSCGPKIAFWGHGRDFSQASPDTGPERWKRFWSARVDYWFAYTERSAAALDRTGFPAERIAVVNNAADTRLLAERVRGGTVEARRGLHQTLWQEERQDDHRVAVFCSRLLPSKGLDLLLAAATLIHEQCPAFRLLVIGDGPLRSQVEHFALESPWCACHGPVYGVDRAPLLSLADLWLNPGTTGLAVLDAFACGVPFITTQRSGHGPELAYLTDNNSLVLEATAEAIAEAVVALLQSPERLAVLKQGAHAAATRYTVEAMAVRFADGIIRCLGERA